MVDTANAFRIRVFLKDMLLKLLKKQRVILIVLKECPVLVH